MSNLPDIIYKTFWTAVAAALSYLSANFVLDLGPTWTPLATTAWTALLVAAREWVSAQLAKQREAQADDMTAPFE